LGITLLMVQQGHETAAIASTISASAAVSLPLPLVLGWLSDRMARKQILLMINGLAAGGLLVLASASWLWHFWLSAMMFGIGDRSQGVTQAYAVDLTPPGALGRNLALLGSSGGIAGVVGLGSAGFVMELIGIRATMAAIAGLAMVSMLLLMCIRMPAPVVDLTEGQPQEEAPLYQSAVSGKRIDTDVEAV
jgi:predicted MFS family arabinose efflux permease